MATSNFWSMDNFPIYANMEEMDWIEADEFYSNVEEVVDEFNEDLLFFKVSLKSGYYEGVQFYVEDKEDFGKYMNEFTNDDCHYYFDVCRSVAIRKYYSEINKINRWLKKTAKEWGFIQLSVVARFSNGETIYEIVK